MLPTILSDCLCSLQQNNRRFAFVIDILLDDDSNILSIKYTNCLIKVFKNFAYEETALFLDTDYTYLLETCQRMSSKYKYINSVRNSHEVVCYLMIFMNYHCAQDLLKFNNGIFRSTIVKKQIVKDSSINSLQESLPEEVNKFIKIWNSSSGQYIDLQSIADKNKESIIRHDLLEMDAYIHITSPIRRLVDLLNIIKFQQNTGIIQLSENSTEFYNKWIDNLEYINTTMRSIRRVQVDCTLLDLCSNNQYIMEKEYDGYLFDKILRNDGLFQFMVFLPELKLSSRITLRMDIDNFENKKFKLFLFNDEESFKKKIRLHLL